MREIKFRAWDKRLERLARVKGWRQSLEGISEISVHSIPNPDFYLESEDNFILMQFTGLKDKNGKEIYEGDIVKTDATEFGELILKVGFSNGAFALYGSWGFCNYVQYHEGKLEIIGNIYENPELLKQE